MDATSERFKNFHTLMNGRNDFLHGNVDPTKLKFDSVFFDYGTIPSTGGTITSGELRITSIYMIVRLSRWMPGWRNGRRCGLKILIPASNLVLPNDTKQYLPTFQPSKQAYVVLGITR